MHNNTVMFLHNFFHNPHRSGKFAPRVPDSSSTQGVLNSTVANTERATVSYGTESTPFFLVGCVRSGTTLLRDILRMHPRLEGAEESHFFRWSDPFATPRYTALYKNNGDLKESRRLDQITEEEFFSIFTSAQNRKELQDAYCKLYLAKQRNPSGRWFDKTPQNIYGLFLLKEAYPEATFVHIHRNPLNVAASLRKGVVMPSMTLTAAINYWNDSYIMMRDFSKLYPESVYTIPYLQLTTYPQQTLSGLLHHVHEDPDKLTIPEGYVYAERNAYTKSLLPSEQQYIQTACANGMRALGYV